jgi:cell division protein FtsI/penicillin-binding protein 2
VINQRLRVFATLYGILALTVIVRLYIVQFPDRKIFISRAAFGHKSVVTREPLRGAIYDRDGQVMVRDRCAFEIFLHPSTFRERSAIYALADLLWLFDRSQARQDGYAAFQKEVRGHPERYVRRFWELDPKSQPEDWNLRPSAEEILLRAPGGLLREREELPFRVRQALHALFGLPSVMSRADFDRWSRSSTVSPALGFEPETALARVNHELHELRSLATEMRLSSLEDLWELIERLMDAESRWVRTQYDRELASAAALEFLGVSMTTPDAMGQEAWATFAKSAVGMPFREGPADAAAAQLAVRGMSDLLAGALPHHPHAANVTAPPMLSEASELSQRAGLADLRTESVVTAWLEKVRQDAAFDEEELIPGRRRRELRNRDRGARPWRLGSGLSEAASDLVVGPGRLARLGFQLKASFTRDEALVSRLHPSTQWILGDVSERERRGRRGVEAQLDTWLRGVPGSLVYEGEMAPAEEIPPEHGRDVSLSLSLSLQDALAEVMRTESPAGVAVIDLTDGGILGMATSPAPESVELGREERLRHQEHLLWLRRYAGPSSAQDMQERWMELDRLGANMSEADLRERRFLRERMSLGAEDLAAERVKLGLETWTSASWHRAYESAGAVQPGSVFKAITILAGLERGVITTTDRYDCVQTRSRVYHRCKDHGPGLDIATALGLSCNEYCYQVGDLLGTEALVDMYQKLGFFDAIPGLLPASGPGSREALLSDSVRNLAIGGGSLDCPPVRAAALAGSLAIGRVVRPWLASTADPDFHPIGEAIPGADQALAVRLGMEAVCSHRGTARRYVRDLDRLRVAAKTGTHDFTAADGSGRNQAWFVGYAPRERPRVAFAVVYHATQMEGADAAPLAIKVLDQVRRVLPEAW